MVALNGLGNFTMSGSDNRVYDLSSGVAIVPQPNSALTDTEYQAEIKPFQKDTPQTAIAASLAKMEAQQRTSGLGGEGRLADVLHTTRVEKSVTIPALQPQDFQVIDPVAVVRAMESSVKSETMRAAEVVSAIDVMDVPGSADSPDSAPTIVSSVSPSGFGREFLYLSEDDPFAQIIVSVPRTELMILLPNAGVQWEPLVQGSRLTSLASNGYWLQARSDRGRVGFIRRADVAIEAMRFLSKTDSTQTGSAQYGQ